MFITQTTELFTKEREILSQSKSQYLNEIKKLPKGVIYSKKTSGKNSYFYLEYYCDETKKKSTRYIPVKELDKVRKELEKRKELERLVKKLSEDIRIIDELLKPMHKQLQKNNSVAEKLNNISDSTQSQSPETNPPSNIKKGDSFNL